MTQTPLPAAGGTYIRHPDGSLELVEGSITASAETIETVREPTPEVLASPARKGALKAPMKE